jgi:protein-ribulosamine 3-kinase
MMFPDSILNVLQTDHGLIVHDSTSVSGGSINQSVKVDTDKGPFFLKWNTSAPDDFFTREAEGLRLLKSAKAGLRIPDVIAVDDADENRPAFLLMEYIESGSGGDSFAFGRNLAQLHQSTANLFGLDIDNYIGSLPQSNRRHSKWSDFYSEERIIPQLNRAISAGKMSPDSLKQWDRIIPKLDNLLPQSTPTLIHGDLWGGNYLFDRSGTAVLIDPAVYYGHPEMDLAFSRMFGGFSDDFYRGYESVTPLAPGFEDRIPLHNLYPLLVHANLFGGHYVRQVESVLKGFA